MLRSGKSSGRCDFCKRRKIKCDELRPSCSQCIKSGWACPGYSNAPDIKFRNVTPQEIVRSQGNSSNSTRQLRAEFSYVRSLLPAHSERGIAFFLHQFVFCGKHQSVTWSRGNHEYLPRLLAATARAPDTGVAKMALENITAAAGLAGLANSTNAQNLIPEAYGLYGSAIRHVRSALQDPNRAIADETLAAVMLMGTFEAIVSADKESLKSYGHHTLAAARLIEQRGLNQFKTEEAIRLLHQVRRLIIMTAHQMQEPLPEALLKWSQWASPLERPDEFQANRFGEMNARLAAYRAAIKYQKIIDPSKVTAMLLPIDKELEDWKDNLPGSWQPKSYRSLERKGNHSITEELDSCYDLYPDLWVASMYNNYRNVRILIHETIMSITIKYGSPQQISGLNSSIEVLEDMTTQVCRSAAFFLGRDQSTNTVNSDPDGENAVYGPGIPGGYLLVWPLYFAGMLRTTSREQKLWIASRMDYIAKTTGLSLANSLAQALKEPDEKSFSDTDYWFIGEFLPQ